jgi:PAS domain S-box-containing protein
MASELERELARLKPGDHLCTTHETLAEEIAVAVPFVRHGLARGERCISIGEEKTTRRLTKALVDVGVMVARERRRGALQVVADLHLFRLLSGEFDPRAMVEFLRQAASRARAEGFPGLRVAGDMAWAMGLGVPPDRPIEFETLLDQFLRDSPSVVLCQYDRARFDPALIYDVLRTHPLAVLGDLICPNPYYEPPELLLQADPPGSAGFKAKRVGWWIGQLMRLRAAERERERIEEALRVSEGRFRTAFAEAAVGVELMTPEGRFLQVNAAYCAMTGYTEDELLKTGYQSVTHPDDLPEYTRLIHRLLAGDITSFVMEKRYNNNVGEVVWHQDSVSLVRDKEGKPLTIIALVEDVTGRKRLEEALRDHAGRLEAATRRVFEVQEEERRSLARELHDEIGQVLTTISINLQLLRRSCGPEARPRIEDSLGVVQRTIEQVRGLALDLRPSILDDLGLAAALRWLVDRQARRAGLAGHFSAPASGPPLHPDVATACFRVAQEALSNVLRHARARNVWVRLKQDDAGVQLVVRDDGIGFDPREARRRSSRGASLGLLGIRERAEILGGRAVIDSEPGHGTSVLAWFPPTPTPMAGPGEGARGVDAGPGTP